MSHARALDSNSIQQPFEEGESRDITPLEDLIAEDFGSKGTPKRTQFDEECDAFIAEYINNN